MKKLYITTPIYYASGKPHIGHAYTTILADIINRYQRLLGRQTFFLVGMDEHGQKIADLAAKLQKHPQFLVDQYSQVFAHLWEKLKIDYSVFIRTTYQKHQEVVQKVILALEAKNYLYLGKWKSWYCPQCEENCTMSQISEHNGIFYCPQKHLLEAKKEECYFLKIAQFRNWIKDFIQQPGLIFPSYRVNELINSFLNNDDFSDLAISRSRFYWGVSMPQDPKHVVYVWFDALLSYLSGLGYLQTNDAYFRYFWNSDKSEVLHLMSKEITRFHCLYWPIFLKMLGLKTPDKFICHGWILYQNQKMSKSLANTLDPLYFVEKYGLDSFRYYLAKEVSIKNDATFSEALLVSVHNSDLVNNFANLIARFWGMFNKYVSTSFLDFKFFDFYLENQLNLTFKNNLLAFDAEIKQLIPTYDVQAIVQRILDLIIVCNHYIEQQKPWDLYANKQILETHLFLNLLYCAIKRILYYLSPILVDATKAALDFFQINPDYFSLTFVENFHNYIHKNPKGNIFLYTRYKVCK